MKIRIATRNSPLALWQANFVKKKLEENHPDVEVELLGIVTTADKMLATPLNKIGGKGLFVKELEKALLENKADIAVHSIKDMPAVLPDGLVLGVICEREDPRDAFVSNQYNSIYEMPAGAVLGTSSLRRKAQALALRPDLTVKFIRGNVGSRLKKLDEGEFDAIILASAGLLRLEMQSRIKSYFTTREILPAAGQGAIGIECRSTDRKILDLISPLNDKDTCFAISAERVISEKLGGSCQFPIAAFAVIENDCLLLEALVGDPSGKTLLRASKNGNKEKAHTIGLQAAEDLIEQGALNLLRQVLAEDTSNDTSQ